MSSYLRPSPPPVADLPLFMPPRARTTDPVTSKLAGEEIVRSGRIGEQHRFVLAAVRSQPGKTALELDRLNGTDRVFGRRLSELARFGLVVNGAPKRCDISGKLSLTWWPKEKGDRT